MIDNRKNRTRWTPEHESSNAWNNRPVEKSAQDRTPERIDQLTKQRDAWSKRFYEVVKQDGVICSDCRDLLERDEDNLCHMCAWTLKTSAEGYIKEIAELKARLETATDWEALRVMYDTYTHNTLNPEFAEIMADAYEGLLEFRGVK